MATYDDVKRQMGGLDPFDAPTPGESLTSSAESPNRFEQPPQFTNQEKAVEEIFMRLTDPDNIDSVLDLMRDEVPVESITQTVLFEGFRQGMYTPDLMLNLAEPTIYMLLYLADYANIDNVRLAGEGGSSPMPVPMPTEGGESMPMEGDMSVEGKTIPRPESVKPSLLESLGNKANMEQM